MMDLENKKTNIIILVKIGTKSFIIFIFNFEYEFKFKICLCTIGKQENKYIIEFIQYYKDFGVDKIYLYDNNDENNEKFEDIISEYIKIGFVQIINVRGKRKIQFDAMRDCYKKNYKKYNWLIFYDIDEFLFLKNYTNIKKFLREPKFKKCQVIQLNWVMHTDNNLLYYNNQSLFLRFPEIGKSLNSSVDIKSMIRGKLNTDFYSIHYLSPGLVSCDGFGKQKDKYNYFSKNRDKKFYYIKMMRGDVATGSTRRFGIISNYFELNKKTLEKIIYIEKKTGLNLTELKKNIINNKTATRTKVIESRKTRGKNRGGNSRNKPQGRSTKTRTKITETRTTRGKSEDSNSRGKSKDTY